MNHSHPINIPRLRISNVSVNDVMRVQYGEVGRRKTESKKYEKFQIARFSLFLA